MGYRSRLLYWEAVADVERHDPGQQGPVLTLWAAVVAERLGFNPDEALVKSCEPDDLAERAFALYERPRPDIPAGKKGWGAKGTLDLQLIPSLEPAK